MKLVEALEGKIPKVDSGHDSANSSCRPLDVPLKPECAGARGGFLVVEASALPRQISRTEYVTPKTDQEAKKSQIVTENSSETPQLDGVVGKQGYGKAPLNVSTANEKYCLYCALAFTPNPKNPKAKFCSTSHRVAYWRRQRKLYPKQVPQLQAQPLATAADNIDELNKFWEALNGRP